MQDAGPPGVRPGRSAGSLVNDQPPQASLVVQIIVRKLYKLAVPKQTIYLHVFAETHLCSRLGKLSSEVVNSCHSDFVRAAALAMWSWTAAGGALGGGNERLLS